LYVKREVLQYIDLEEQQIRLNHCRSYYGDVDLGYSPKSVNAGSTSRMGISMLSWQK